MQCHRHLLRWRKEPKPHGMLDLALFTQSLGPKLRFTHVLYFRKRVMFSSGSTYVIFLGREECCCTTFSSVGNISFGIRPGAYLASVGPRPSFLNAP